MKTQIKMVPIKDIKKNPDNPRTIKDAKFKDLVQSIKDFPDMLEIRRVVLDENMMLLGGSQRTDASAAAGLTDVPAVIVTGWTEERKREFTLKDNGHHGEWDIAMLNDWNMPNLDAWGIQAFSDVTTVHYKKKQQPIGVQYHLTIDVSNEAECKNLKKRMQAEGYICKITQSNK